MCSEAKDDGSGGGNWSYKLCKAPVKSSPPTNQHPFFLQTGCPSCRPTNSVKALKGKVSHSMDLLTPSYPMQNNIILRCNGHIDAGLCDKTNNCLFSIFSSSILARTVQLNCEVEPFIRSQTVEIQRRG